MRKSSSPSRPSSRRARADRRRHLRTRGRLARQEAGMRTTTPARFQIGGAGQEARSLLRGPAQRVKDLAGIDHRLEPGACLGGALHRQQQRQQLALFAAPAYSRSAWPSGRCCALACAESCVV